MKRPAFQFYTKDWQTNLKLRRCSPAARGVWMDVLCLMHQSEEYGVLRWPLKEIANTAGAALPLVKELVSKGVLKGGDQGCAPYIFTPKHAGKEGAPVVLLEATRAACWYSSRFIRDEYVRGRRGESTRFDAENQPPNRQPKGGLGEQSGYGPPVSNLQSTDPLKKPTVSNEGGAATPRATRKCPKSFNVTDELLAWAAEQHPTVDAAHETEKLRDHTFGNAISDWAGAWRNWIRRAGEFRGGAKSGPAINKQTAIEARNRTVADEWAAGEHLETH